MRILIYLSMVSFCSLLLPTTSFVTKNVRSITKTATLLKGRRKNIDSLFINQITSSKKSKKNVYQPKSDNQRKYLEYLQDINTSVVLGIGPAGCGKTMFACLQAIQELKTGNIHKIVLTRPVVPVEEEELGFLPGNLVKKMDPWTRPILDIFLEFYQQNEIENMIQCGILEISPLAYMRGRTFKNSFIIADEMQNSTPNQMLMLTTRIGDNSKMVITGDLKQSDRSLNNGLSDFINKLQYHNTIQNEQSIVKMITMNTQDVQRSLVVTHILDIYNNSTFTDNNNQNEIQQYKNDDCAMVPINSLPKNNFNKENWEI